MRQLYDLVGVTPYPSDYILPIPAQTISFNLTAISTNNPPVTPTVTPQPFSGNTNTAYPFTFTGTDPDNDQIRYGIDWNNDGLVDQYTAYVASGTPQSLGNPLNQWPTLGTYSFRVRTEDSKGGVSGWAIPSVTLQPLVNGLCGPATLLPSGPTPTIGLCESNGGTPTLVTPSGSLWQWQCIGSGLGHTDSPCTTTVQTYTPSATKILDSGAAGTITDINPTATSIDSAAPRNSEVVPYNASRTLRANPTSSSVSWSGCNPPSTSNDCTISNITSDKPVQATFSRLAEPGVCGSARGQSFATLNAGSLNLCSSGAIASFSLSGVTYSWNCNGLFGSLSNASCSATQARDYNWKEVAP